MVPQFCSSPVIHTAPVTRTAVTVTGWFGLRLPGWFRIWVTVLRFYHVPLVAVTLHVPLPHVCAVGSHTVTTHTRVLAVVLHHTTFPVHTLLFAHVYGRTLLTTFPGWFVYRTVYTHLVTVCHGSGYRTRLRCIRTHLVLAHVYARLPHCTVYGYTARLHFAVLARTFTFAARLFTRIAGYLHPVAFTTGCTTPACGYRCHYAPFLRLRFRLLPFTFTHAVLRLPFGLLPRLVTRLVLRLPAVRAPRTVPAATPFIPLRLWLHTPRTTLVLPPHVVPVYCGCTRTAFTFVWLLRLRCRTRV